MNDVKEERLQLEKLLSIPVSMLEQFYYIRSQQRYATHILLL